MNQSKNLDSKDILIVEDSPTQAEILKYLLEQKGYSVAYAKNGKKALEIIHNINPKIVVSDILMPEMDGYELCRAIKHDNKFKDTAVILLTALSNPKDVINGLTSGADTFITKPYSEKFLLSRIEYILVNRQLRATQPIEDQTEIFYDGEKYHITAITNRLQIIDLLFSTFENAVQKNQELEKANQELMHTQHELQVKNDKLISFSKRYELLAETAGQLLKAKEPHEAVVILCEKVMVYLECQIYMNFIIDEHNHKLNLNAYSGIPEEIAKKFCLVEYNAVVSGPVILSGKPISIENFQSIDDHRIDLLKSLGVRAYCSHPLIDEKGKIVGTLSFGSAKKDSFNQDDISLMKAVSDQVSVALVRLKNEIELKHHTEELDSINKELESFSYSVSHDLRTPLKVISGLCNALFEDYAKQIDDKGREYLSRILKNTSKMNELIDDMLSLSKITRQEMTTQEINMSMVAESIIEELQTAYPSRKTDVIIQKAMKARGDIRLMTIALSNLLRNAWKFTSKTMGPRIEFSSFIQNGHTVFKIQDNGAGFNMEQADKLFEPFKRLHSEQEFPGTGIGLAIVDKIIKRHGGRLWAEGKLGAGASFFFTLA